MHIDIRESIKKNFCNSKTDDIKLSIEEAIEEHDEITLPGLGVFFEIIWTQSDTNFKKNILSILENNIKKD